MMFCGINPELQSQGQVLLSGEIIDDCGFSFYLDEKSGNMTPWEEIEPLFNVQGDEVKVLWDEDVQEVQDLIPRIKMMVSNFKKDGSTHTIFE